MAGIVCCRPHCAFRQEDVAMTFRICSLLLTTAGLWMTLPLPAQEPAQLNVELGPDVTPHLERSVNQKLADAIAEPLRQSGRLPHYEIEVVFRDGTAELNGTVADQPQHDEVLSIVRGLSGVEQVVDLVTSAATTPLTPVQAGAPSVETSPPGPVPNPHGPNYVVEPQPVS